MEFSLKGLSRRLRCPDSELERFIKHISYPVGDDIIVQSFELDDGCGIIGFYDAGLDDEPNSVHLTDYKRFEVAFINWSKHQKNYPWHVWKSFRLLFNPK